MKKLIKKFGGAIFFYVVIFGMIMLVNHRFGELNANKEPETIAYVITD